MTAEQVARYPILLDELLNTEALRNPLPFTQYPDELKQYMLRLPQDDEEQFIDGLRQFKQSIFITRCSGRYSRRIACYESERSSHLSS